MHLQDALVKRYFLRNFWERFISFILFCLLNGWLWFNMSSKARFESLKPMKLSVTFRKSKCFVARKIGKKQNEINFSKKYFENEFSWDLFSNTNFFHLESCPLWKFSKSDKKLQSCSTPKQKQYFSKYNFYWKNYQLLYQDKEECFKQWVINTISDQ